MPDYEAVLNFSSPTGEIKNVLHYRTAALQGSDLQDATDEIQLQWNTLCRNRFAPSVSFVSVTWREDTPGAVGVEYFVPLSPVPGSAADNQYAAAEAAIIRKRCTDGSNPARGRMYIGGITSEAFNSVGNWGQDTIDDLVAWVEAIAQFTAGSPATVFNMLIKASNPAAPNTNAYNIVDTIQGIVRPATQRRRRRGIGT